MIYIFNVKKPKNKNKRFKIIFNYTFGLHFKYLIDSPKSVKIGRIMSV